MSRRPTRDHKRSSYITPEGAQRLRDEHHRLWTVERPRVTREVSEAAALGDRSENAEYIYGKRRLREIDSRLEFLNKRLEEVVIVETQVREDAITLFGFAEAAERTWFKALQAVQGVGARSALAILGVHDPTRLAAVIAAQDKAALTRAPGVGPFRG